MSHRLNFTCLVKWTGQKFLKYCFKIILYLKYSPGQVHKGNGKAIPLQACAGPEGSRRMRLPDFKTIGT